MIQINGKTYRGNSVTIINGKVIVDGVVQGSEDLSKEQVINIDATGFRGHLSVDGNVNVNGNIDGQIKAQGSVSCNNVYGDVNAGGSVNCDDIKGDVVAGGSINCDDIIGHAKAGGSIHR